VKKEEEASPEPGNGLSWGRGTSRRKKGSGRGEDEKRKKKREKTSIMKKLFGAIGWGGGLEFREKISIEGKKNRGLRDGPPRITGKEKKKIPGPKQIGRGGLRGKVKKFRREKRLLGRVKEKKTVAHECHPTQGWENVKNEGRKKEKSN